MFCEKCGAQIDDNSTFCEKCGAKIEQEAPKADSSQAQDNDTVQSEPAPQQPTQATSIQLSKKHLTIIAAVIVVIVAAIIIKSNWTYTVDLNKFITVEYSGYDTVGTATFTFDKSKFTEKYSGKIKAKDKDTMSDDDDIGDIFYYALSGSYPRSMDNLTNGDEITFSWSSVPEDEIKKEFNCKLKYDDTTYTVENLEAVNSIDPFEKIDVEFEGVAPYGSARWENNNDSPVSDVYFTFDKSSELSNGDEVVLKASDSSINDYLAKNYGVVISPTEKTYTVEGLDSYVTSKEQISDDILKEMKSQSEDVIKSITAKWSDNCALVSSDYVGYYLLMPKSSTNYYGDKNDIYLVYKLTASFTTDEYNPAVNYSYYYVIRYKDLLVNDAGECTVDITNYSTVYENFSQEFKYGSDHHNRSYSTKGYKTIDDFVRKNITANADKYTYETTIKE